MPTYGNTAVFYHLIHGLALFILALRGTKVGRFVKIILLAGILCFSGSLYGLAVDNSLKFLGPITPSRWTTVHDRLGDFDFQEIALTRSNRAGS